MAGEVRNAVFDELKPGIDGKTPLLLLLVEERVQIGREKLAVDDEME